MPQIQIEIICDSINPDGQRLTTGIATMPRYVLAEWNTHRMISRNAASSRAIPVEKLISMARQDPVTPFIWGKNQKGMQSYEMLADEDRLSAQAHWRRGTEWAVQTAEALLADGLHKQWSNRWLECVLPVKVLFSATDLGNFFNLRAHSAAMPDFCQLSYLFLWHYHRSVPVKKAWGEWHIPFGADMAPLPERLALLKGTTALFPMEDKDTMSQLMIATARAARISYLNFEGQKDTADDYRIHDDLARAGHWSPFEHSAMAEPATPKEWDELQDYLMQELRNFPSSQARASRLIAMLEGKVRNPQGNFRGWRQYRQFFPRENRQDYDYDELMSRKPDWVQMPEELPAPVA